MKLFAIFSALLASFAIAHGDHDHDDPNNEENGDVVVLTDANFESWIKEHDLSLIEFYAPWCGHCKALKPEYETAATELLGKVPLAKVDCTVEKETCQAQGIEGFPTLKVFRGKSASPFKGQRSAASIVEFMKKAALPAISKLDAKTLEEFKTSSKVVVVGYFAASEKDPLATFTAVAEKLREDVVFGTVSDEALLKKESVKGFKVVLYKTFDEKLAAFDEKKLTEEALTKFIETKSIPIMDDIGPENYEKFMKSGLPMAYFFFSTPEERSTLGPKFEELAKSFLGKIIFIYIDAVQFGGHADNLGIKKDWPAFGIHLPDKNEKYPFPEVVKASNFAAVEKFVKDFDAGKVEPFFKSEEIPESNDKPVKVIVGKNFDDIVLDKTKDVLVEFYAPWCGHCKKLAPIWDSLGEKVGSDKIVIAKMDATANDPKGDVKIEGFPTIILFKAGDNSMVPYNGDRTVDGFLGFLKENAGNGSGLEGASVEVESDDASEEEEGSDEL